MSLNFVHGRAKVQILRDGVTFDVDNLPWFFNSISSVEAETRFANIGKIKVVLTPSFTDGLRILESGLLGTYLGKPGQSPASPSQAAGAAQKVSKPASSQVALPPVSSGNREPLQAVNTTYLMVKFLYPGQLDNDGSEAETSWYMGMMTVPNVEITGGSITITINARSVGGVLSDIQGAYTFKNQSCLSVLEALVKPIGLEIQTEVGDTETLKLLTERKITGAFNEPKIQSIKAVLFAADCYWVEDAGDNKEPQSRILVKARSKIADGQITFTFVMFRDIDPANNVIPIYDFQLINSRNLFLPGAAYGSFQRTFNEKTKKVENFEVGSKDVDGTSYTGSETTGGTLYKSTPQPGGGNMGATDSSDDEMAGQSHITIERDDSHNKDEAKSATKRAVHLGPSYNLTVPGLPKLKTLTACQVIVGDKIPGLSSIGMIRSIEHIVDSNGWKSKIVVNQTGGVGDASLISNFNNKEVGDVKKAAVSNVKESKPV